LATAHLKTHFGLGHFVFCQAFATAHGKTHFHQTSTIRVKRMGLRAIPDTVQIFQKYPMY
jgi:hypothetical protein